MKSKVLLYFILTIAVIVASIPAGAQSCNTIKNGKITDQLGNNLTLGYDQWGYNYQAHQFNGYFENYSRPLPPVTTSTMTLVMKWSDDWLSNKDCNGDGKLDRGLDPKTGISDGTSRGWVTNHFEGDYLGSDGEMHHYNEEVKVVFDNGAACAAGGAGCIWGSYNIIEDVVNDAFGEFWGSTTPLHGNLKEFLVNPAGLGYWNNQF